MQLPEQLLHLLHFFTTPVAFRCAFEADFVVIVFEEKKEIDRLETWQSLFPQKRIIYFTFLEAFEKTGLIQAKLYTIFGLNTKIHARNTIGRVLQPTEVLPFLQEYHWLGYTPGFLHIGLFWHRKLLMVASFDEKIVMRYETPIYTSVCWKRLATRCGYTVVGGLQKLLHFSLQYQPADHIYTPVDRFWGSADAFLQAGFKKIGGRKDPRNIHLEWWSGDKIVKPNL